MLLFSALGGGRGGEEAQKRPSVGCWLGMLLTDMETSRAEAPLILFVCFVAPTQLYVRLSLHTSHVSYGKLLLPSVCCHLVNICSGLDRSSGHQIRLASLLPGPDEEPALFTGDEESRSLGNWVDGSLRRVNV